MIYNPARRYDTFGTLAAAQDLCALRTRQAAVLLVIEKKEASRAKIVAGIKSLTAEDLCNLRDWIVALMQLRSG